MWNWIKNLFTKWMKKDIIQISIIKDKLEEADTDKSGMLSFYEIKEMVKKVYKEAKEKIKEQK